MNQEQRAAARARCEEARQFPYTGLPANLARPALLEDLPAALDALDAADAEIARLRAALEALHDFCGPPRHYRYEQRWQDAMSETEELLGGSERDN